MKPSFSIKGGKTMEKKLLRIARKTPDVAGSALYLEGELIMTRSKRDYVPVAEGTLKSSGHVARPEHVGDNIRVTMSYGGAAAAYALAIHEHPSQFDPPSWQGKTIIFSPELGGEHGVKYLEKPMNAAIPGMPQRLGITITRLLAIQAAGS